MCFLLLASLRTGTPRLSLLPNSLSPLQSLRTKHMFLTRCAATVLYNEGCDSITVTERGVARSLRSTDPEMGKGRAVLKSRWRQAWGGPSADVRGPWRELSRGPQAWDIGGERASDRCLSATSSCFALPSKYAPFRLRKNRFV